MCYKFNHVTSLYLGQLRTDVYNCCAGTKIISIFEEYLVSPCTKLKCGLR